MTGEIAGPAEDGDATRFLIKLGPKLTGAKTLIEDCKQSRLDLELVAAQVHPTFQSLNSLTENVANVVAGMTIVGTNAMVKSHRLGQGGAGLSVIAQHLRSHALKVADEIKRFGPFLDSAARLTDEFSISPESKDALRFEELGSRMT